MGWLGRVLLVAALAVGVVGWQTGRLRWRETNPILQKVNDAIGESAAKSRVEVKRDGVIVHITLMTQSQRYRASDIATNACAAASRALNGEENVSVILQGPPDEAGYARVYGSASYSRLTGRISWSSHQ
jgi:methyl coenzyme M reductase subunit C-like uncharacterized protein (methanogenesis marker protein 7)